MGLSAQTWSEWFRQKKTQKKYLLQQIAALQVYADYASKGYGIARDGLGIIGNIRKGDFSMHSNYFSSLIKVNPQVRGSIRRSQALSLCSWVLSSQAKHALSQFNRTTNNLPPAEVAYLRNVFKNLLEGSAQRA